MPRYDFRNKNTGEVIEKTLTLSEREEFLKQDEWEQVHLATPTITTHVNGVLSKTDDNFKDLLKNIKNNSGRDNTIKV